MISRSLPRPLLRVLPHPVLSVLLLLVWLLLVDSFAIGHWLLGASSGRRRLAGAAGTSVTKWLTGCADADWAGVRGCSLTTPDSVYR